MARVLVYGGLEKKGQKILLALRGLELTDFGSTAQWFTNDATNKSLRNVVHWRNKAIH